MVRAVHLGAWVEGGSMNHFDISSASQTEEVKYSHSDSAMSPLRALSYFALLLLKRKPPDWGSVWRESAGVYCIRLSRWSHHSGKFIPASSEGTQGVKHSAS